MTIADTRRPGTGTWAERVAAHMALDLGPGTPTDKQARALARHPELWAHPERTAQAHAHEARHRGTCAADNDPTLLCDCTPYPDALAAAWAGLTRMAAARRAAGQPLNDLDRQALDRLDTSGADPR